MLKKRPISPSGLDLLIKEWIWLSRDFRNQLSKRLHSRNSSPTVFTSLGLLSGSSPKHLNPAPPKSVAYRASPHKDWEHGKRTQPQPSKGKTDLRTVIISKAAAGKKTWCPRAQANEDSPPEVERSTPHFTVSVSLRGLKGTVLPTLPPRVLQGAAVSGERISQGPPGNVVALGCPPPPRRVSERSVQTLPVGSPFQNVVLTAQLHINPETSLERLVPLVEFWQRGNFCQIYLIGSCRL